MIECDVCNLIKDEEFLCFNCTNPMQVVCLECCLCKPPDTLSLNKQIKYKFKKNKDMKKNNEEVIINSAIAIEALFKIKKYQTSVDINYFLKTNKCSYVNTILAYLKKENFLTCKKGLYKLTTEVPSDIVESFINKARLQAIEINNSKRKPQITKSQSFTKENPIEQGFIFSKGESLQESSNERIIAYLRNERGIEIIAKKLVEY